MIGKTFRMTNKEIRMKITMFRNSFSTVFLIPKIIFVKI